jgi:hypothetical protein
MEAEERRIAENVSSVQFFLSFFTTEQNKTELTSGERDTIKQVCLSTCESSRSTSIKEKATPLSRLLYHCSVAGANKTGAPHAEPKL